MNCSFNIRYKPRTTRQFTKSDLTVYDSADNTALNALTVYGKSEVVDGSIISAGESGSIEVQTYTGTNQFGGLDFAQKLYENTITSTIDTTNKTVTFSRSKTEGDDILYNNFKANTQYTLILTYINDSRNTSLLIKYTDNTRTQITLEPVTQKTNYRIVTNANKSVQSFALAYYGAGLTTLYYDECGIFEGVKTESDFEPYTGTMATFTTGTPLRGIPDTDVRDVMVWDGSSGAVTKNCGEVDLGTLTWNYSSEYLSFSTRITDMATGTYSIAGNILCANYQTKSQAVLDTESTGIAVANNANVIIIKDPVYTDAAAFKTAMSGVMLVYEIATPITEQLTATENASIAGLRTFTPQTHAQNNAQTDMTVDYTIRVPTI